MNENLKETKLHTKPAPRIVNATTDVLAELMDSCKDVISKIDIDKIIKEERRMSLAERRVIIVERKARSKERDTITHAKENYNKANQAIIDEYVKRLNDETKPLSDEEKDKYLNKLETIKEDSKQTSDDFEKQYNTTHSDATKENGRSKLFDIVVKVVNVASKAAPVVASIYAMYKLSKQDNSQPEIEGEYTEVIDSKNTKEIEG